MREKHEIRKDMLTVHYNAINSILGYVGVAESEVLASESNRYWKACETLYRLTLHIYDIKNSLDAAVKKLNQEMKEVLEAEKNTEVSDTQPVKSMPKNVDRIQDNIENREFREAQAWANN